MLYAVLAQCQAETLKFTKSRYTEAIITLSNYQILKLI